MIYNPYSSELITVGATNEIYRLNLDLGRFTSTLVGESEEMNTLDFSHDLNVIATGGIDGRVEIWNMQHKHKVLGLLPQGVNHDEEITSLRF